MTARTERHSGEVPGNLVSEGRKGMSQEAQS